MQAWLTEAITVSKGGNSEWLPRKGPTHYRKTQIPPDEYEQLFTQVTNRVGFPGHSHHRSHSHACRALA